MKRSSTPEHGSTPRRKRTLSGEEQALWESVVKSIKPLTRKVRAIKAKLAEDAPPDKKPERPPTNLPSQLATPARIAKSPINKPAPSPPLAPIGRRERTQLSRGRKEIDARIDLHGMTQASAHRALLAFLHRASAEGMTFVLVITGKGARGENPERGVLRRRVPEWLSLPEFRGLVVGFEQAHIGHGGAGALYVRVRRAR